MAAKKQQQVEAFDPDAQDAGMYGESQAVAVIDPPPATPLATRAPASLARPTGVSNSRLEGGDRDDQLLPRIHLYQGLPNEAKEYGRGFEPGDLINTVTREKVASRKFVPILGYKEWIKWKEPRGSGMEYKKRVKTDVPPEDLIWNEHEVDKKKRQPKATESINWVVLFEDEAVPSVLTFSRTSLNAGKTINTLETMRGNRGPGLYAFDFRDKSNEQGAWITPVIRPTGDPTPDMSELVGLLYTSLSGTTIETNPDGDDFDPDAN
jgi:hypothetical protein